jgi:hypothetical protein
VGSGKLSGKILRRGGGCAVSYYIRAGDDPIDDMMTTRRSEMRVVFPPLGCSTFNVLNIEEDQRIN